MDALHVPAWKRLGLKLKYANENAPATVATPTSSESGGKRKQNKGSSVMSGPKDEPQLKKPRLDPETPQRKLSERQSPPSKSTHIEDHNRKRKKSVTFTSDTKADDGDTAQAIQFWHPDSPGSTPKKASTEDDTAQASESPKKPKKEKKPKSQRDHSAPVKPRKATAALDYLYQFHYHHSSWKFNKNHETWILKHALSAEQIPQQQNLALASYIRGLKSAGARQRLADQSREALKTTNDIDQNSFQLRNDLIKALEVTSTDSDERHDQPHWMKDISRGALILLSLDENLQEPRKQAQTNGRPLPRAKKNKSRTARVDVESSSSSQSDSGSDSDDDSEALSSASATNSSVKSTTVVTTTTGIDSKNGEETSSSGSSSEPTTDGGSDSEDSDTSTDDE